MRAVAGGLITNEIVQRLVLLPSNMSSSPLCMFLLGRLAMELILPNLCAIGQVDKYL